MPRHRKERVLIIGAGVAGLTTALCLHERNVDVTVVAENLAPNLTSVVAGALWEWPPAVCGYHQDEVSLARSKDWCMTSFDAFDKLARDAETGVSVRPVTFYFRNRIEENAFHYEKMKEIADRVPGFRRSDDLVLRHDINHDIGLVDAYQHLAPMVDTDVYMGWLRDRCARSGIAIIRRRLDGLLSEQADRLKAEFDAHLIVNCSGLGAEALANDDMYPLRGALVRLVNDGRHFPRLEEAHCVSHDDVTSANDIVFIVPRGRDRVVLGAIAEKDQWSKDINLTNHQPIRQMYERCMEFMPSLRQAKLDPDEPVRVGLRPFRPNNVRVDFDRPAGIVHNYGHGGAGVTLSWGCAGEVVDYAMSFFGRGIEAVDEPRRLSA